MLKKIRSTAAVAAAAVMAATTLVVPAANAQAAPKITWEECPTQVTEPGAECGRISVPTYYSHPERGNISVGFVRIKATGAKRGALFTNPGGPGGDAYAFAGHESMQWPEGITSEWDLIGVQPRGLPGSTKVACTQPSPKSGPLDMYVRQGAFNRAACEETTPGYTRAITTENTARDWEMVRRALGEEKISIMGLSYGTFLGSVYATLYPQHTDRVVLDSAMSQNQAWNGIVNAQQRGYEKSLEDFFAYVARNNSTYRMGTTPLKVYERWSHKVQRESGVRPTVLPPTARVGDLPPGLEFAGQQGANIMTATGQARVEAEHLRDKALNPQGTQLASPTLSLTRELIPRAEQWDDLAKHIANIKPIDLGDPSAAQIREAQAASQQVSVMQNMIMCNENTVAGRPWLLPSYYWSAYVTQDVFRMFNAAYASGAMCEGSPAHIRAPRLSGAGLAVRPLQIQATGDPQTPYHLHRDMARAMGSHVVTIHGPGHGHVAMGNKAVDDIVVNYLRTGHTAANTAPSATAG